MRKGLIWLIAILILLGVGGWLAYRYLYGYATEKKEEFTHYGIKQVGIGEMSAAHGQASFMGYVVLNASLPEWVMPDKIALDATWDHQFRMRAKVLEPRRTDAKVDTLYFKISADAREFLEEVRRQQKKDSSLVEGTITLKGDIPMRDDDKPIVLTFSKKIRHFKFPRLKVTMQDIKVKKLGLKNIKLMTHVEIINLDRYYLAVRNLYVKERVGADMEVELKNEPNLILKPYETKVFQLPTELHLNKPGKVISKIISNKDVYIADMHLKATLALGRTNSQEKPSTKSDSDDSLWQEFPVAVNQKDTIEIMPRKGEDRFAPGQKKKD
jgi:hypothetical protein